MIELLDNKIARYKRQELYNITDKNLIPININDKEYLVYGNVNLSIFLTDKCNGDCKFCVAQLRYINDGSEYVKPSINDIKEYFYKLNQVLDVVKPLNPSLSLTGGEPTIDPKLPTILKILDKHNVRKRTLTTNGSGLLNKVDNSNDTVLDRLIDYKLQHLNISRAHYNEDKNSCIMKIKDPYFSNLQLKEVINIAKTNGIRPRLSCVLLKSEINSLGEMLKYMEWADSIGVDNVVFRQLMKFDENAVNMSKICEYCMDNNVELVPIWEEIDNNNNFTFQNLVLGYYYYVEVFKYKNIDMVCEAADLNLIDSEKNKSISTTGGIPVIYELIFHPNGNLCGSWREWKEVIWN